MTFYRLFNRDPGEGTLYRGDPEPIEAAVAGMIRLRTWFPRLEVWIEPEPAVPVPLAAHS